MRRTLALSHTLVFATLLSAATLLAPTQGFTQSNPQKAQKLYIEHKKKARQKLFPDAISSLQQAIALQPKTTAWILELAQLQKRANLPFPALRSTQQFLNTQPTPRHTKTAQKLLEELQNITQPLLATVQIQAPLDGLNVRVDDSDIPTCTTPCTLSLSPEPHTIHVGGNQGTQPQSKPLQPKPSSSVTLSFQPAGSSPKQGTLQPKTNAPKGSTLLLDGSPKATLPLNQPLSLEAGIYPASIVSPDQETIWSGSITIQPNTLNEPILQTSTQAHNSGTLSIVAYSLWGLSAASLGAGIYFGLQASDTENTLEDDKQAGEPTNTALVEDGRSQSRNANIFFATSALCAGTGLLLFLLDSPSDTPSETPSRVSIAPTMDGLQVQFGGDF